MARTPQGLGILVRGVVQGVGFRPFVFRQAKSLGLTGNVRNTGEGVLIEVYGPREAIESLLESLRRQAPPLAEIEEIVVHPLNGTPPPVFTVLASEHGGKATRLPPDVATCEDCLRELFDPQDRRFRYPFINCTNCGPRFTVVEDLPYDRENTTLRVFPMCAECSAEYSDPANRRFHAEPNACPRCGPRIWLTSRNGERLETEDPLREAVEAVKRGKILAARGLGGFHLIVDALNERACRALRDRKHRPRKPLAVMVPDLETARTLAVLDPAEEEALLSPARPIVLVRQREPSPLAPSIAPGLNLVGLMLPYTPLHHLLLREGGFKALVMTSGNRSGEPLCYLNEEALERLAALADLFLLHDREIVIGLDDSVVRKAAGKVRPVRRARGFVPDPLPFPGGPSILAVGPLLKNTLCLTRNREAFVSQHVGDLENLETENFWQKIRRHFAHLFEIRPEAIACDLHPDYLSTRLAEELAANEGLPLIRVPHHVAHAAAVMGEFGLRRALALCLDGLGLGPDGTLWGGEVLLVEEGRFLRLGHLRPVPQPGGDAANKKTWRMALSFLHQALGEKGLTFGQRLFSSRVPEKELAIVVRMIRRGAKSPLTSSAGRLFDACAALLGVALENTFEGEAPMRLEAVAAAPHRLYPLPARDRVLETPALIREIVRDLSRGVPPEAIAGAVHVSLAEGLASFVREAGKDTGIREVVLSGGCFQNALLSQSLKERLEEAGFEVFLPERLPANDGGLSYGQALWAAWALKR